MNDTTSRRFDTLPDAVQEDIALCLFFCEHYAPQAEQDATERIVTYFEQAQLAAVPVEDRNAIVLDFYEKVCERAERNMELTGTVSGAHWNAMRVILGEMGIQEAAK